MLENDKFKNLIFKTSMGEIELDYNIETKELFVGIGTSFGGAGMTLTKIEASDFGKQFGMFFSSWIY
jgi:hypothetical protein